MTKRMLSLLLALVMTLSLCVPALAADEFEAETVTEVEEQAPEAPAEPAVIAEEPADEPVAAVAAPVEEPADEPETAVVGQVQSEPPEVELLRGAVNSVNKMKGDILAGKYISMGVKVNGSEYYYTPYDYVQGKRDLGIKEVLDQLDAAEALLADADKYQEKTSDINAAYTFLYGVAHLKTISLTVADNGLWDQWMGIADNYFRCKGGFDAFTFFGKDLGHNDYVAADVTVAGNAVWYQPEYLAKAKALVEKIPAAQKSLNYVAVKEIMDGCVELEDAFRYGGTDAADCGAAYQPTPADSQALYDQYVAANKALAGKSNLSIEESEIKTHIGWADSWFKLNYSTGVLTNILRKNVLDLTALLKADINELHENVHAVSISRYDVQNDYTCVKLYFGISQLLCEKKCPKNEDHLEANHDDHKYTVKYTVNGGAERVAMVGGGEMKDWNVDQMFQGGGQSTDFEFPITIVPAGTTGTAKFDANDVIVVKLYDETGAVVQTVNITVNGDYTGPVIVAAGYIVDKTEFNKEAAKWGKRTAMSNSEDNFYVFLSIGPERLYTPVTLEIKSPSGKTVKKVLTYVDETNSRDTWVESVTNAYVSSLPVEVGDYSVTMNVTESNTGKTYTRGTATITVPDITKYAKYADMQAAMAAAAGYETMVATADAKQSTAALRQVVANALKAGQKIVADAATTPNVAFYRDNVLTVLNTLNSTMKFLTAPGSLDALKGAIATAKALVATDYTQTSWKALKDDIDAAVAAGEKLIASQPGNDAGSVAKITAATKAITDLLNKLVIKPADLSALKALVDSVPAKLAADDYTAESKAAVQTAAAAAEALLTAKGVGQSEVDAAVAALQAALAALKVEPEDPDAVKAPASGNGWVHHTDGNYYYFEDGVMMKDYWMMSGRGSAHGLWYYLKADGTLATGFQYVSNHAGSGWYYFQANNDNGCIGRVLAGWQYVNSDIGWGWFQTKHNGHYGECTYTTKWGDYSPGYVPMNP